jgi:cellulose binding protein with CBM3 domain
VQSTRLAPSRKARALLAVFASAVSCVGVAGCFHPARPGTPPTHELTVRYRTGTPADASVAQPWLEVTNTSKHTVSLADVTVRYYFAADPAASYGTGCMAAEKLGCSAVAGRIIAVAAQATGADHYLQLSFTTGALSLEPGKSTGSIALQLYRTDHQQLRQATDHSFTAQATTWTKSTTITAYLRGTLVWGEEPAGSMQSPLSRSASPAAPVPPGIMFDNFHYTAPDDPALFKHGWLVRTSKGSPGIPDTWSAAGVSFPGDPTAQGGQVLQLQAKTDGTKKGTTQAELQTLANKFVTGTFAARTFFTDAPTSGPDGDHINQSFYTISPDDGLSNTKYSELDNEYMPNGGWGNRGPFLDTTSFYTPDWRKESTRRNKIDLKGWHTMVITATNGVVTYYADDRKLFSSSGKFFPSKAMHVNFNTWFIDLPFAGARTWNMKVNWFYCNAQRAMSAAEVQNAVKGYYTRGQNFIDTVPKP